MLTFEETFYIGFFEQAQHSRLFSPVLIDYQARFIAFSEAEEQNPWQLQLMTQEQREREQRWQEALDQLWAQSQRDRQDPHLPHHLQ